MNVCFTFSSEQLDALRRAFGDRLDGEHQIDMRRLLHLPWTQYYLVLQSGRDRRKNLRRTGPSHVNHTAVYSFLCGLSITGVAAGAAWLAMNLLR